jgi:hypothetical protein
MLFTFIVLENKMTSYIRCNPSFSLVCHFGILRYFFSHIERKLEMLNLKVRMHKRKERKCFIYGRQKGAPIDKTEVMNATLKEVRKKGEHCQLELSDGYKWKPTRRC